MTQPKVLKIQDVLALKLNTVDVEIPELGGAIRLRELLLRERVEWEDECKKLKGKKQEDLITCLLLLKKCIVDENNEQMITTDEQFKSLFDLKSNISTRLVRQAMQINALDTDTQEDVKKK